MTGCLGTGRSQRRLRTAKQVNRRSGDCEQWCDTTCEDRWCDLRVMAARGGYCELKGICITEVTWRSTDCEFRRQIAGIRTTGRRSGLASASGDLTYLREAFQRVSRSLTGAAVTASSGRVFVRPNQSRPQYLRGVDAIPNTVNDRCLR